MSEDNTTEFMATEPLEPPTIMMTIPSPPSEPRALTPVPELMEPATPLPFAPAEPAPAEPAPAETVHATLEPDVQVVHATLEPDVQVVPATLEPDVQVVPATLVRQSKVDLLFTALSTNTIILITVHNIKSRGKLETSDIPILLLGIYNEYQNNNKKVVLTIDDLQILIERVYNYLVDKYTLIDPENQAVCFLMFTSALKLLLAVPAVKNKKCLFTCF